MIRRHLLPVVALALTVAGSLAVAAPANAGHADLSIGAAFPVGNGIVSLVIGQPVYRHGYGGGYPAYGRSWESQPFYYRVGTPIHRHHARCSSRCYTRGRYGYHHPSCAALHAYFDAHRVDPVGYWPYRSWSPDWAAYGWRQPRQRSYRDDCRDHRHSRRDCDSRCDDRRYRLRDQDRYGRYDRHDRDERYDDRYDRDWRDRR